MLYIIKMLVFWVVVVVVFTYIELDNMARIVIRDYKLLSTLA